MDAARIWIVPGLAEALGQILGQIAVRVQRLDLDPRVGEVPRVVGADDRGDRPMLVGGGNVLEDTRGRAGPTP
jgi:hypothetical protein